ncbi:MAG: hypothetical protein A2X49_15420 [Lentisphaerae bacterium GWF2_52_8]|nr:MAG: hypothetical protein A2X49_15420 [Lentisphaerae bacterium GWF2_52_8]
MSGKTSSGELLVGRINDPHDLKRIYSSFDEYVSHQRGKEDSPKAYRGLYEQLKDSCDVLMGFLSGQRERILDIGARDGGAVSYFNAKSYAALGVELSPKLVEYCKERDIPVYAGDMHNLQWVDNSFDAIFAKDVLEHSYDPHRALIEWSRVLRVGGILYIECPCLDYNYAFHSYEFRSPEMLKGIVSGVLDVVPVHEREYFTCQTMFSYTVRLKSKKVKYCADKTYPANDPEDKKTDGRS